MDPTELRAARARCGLSQRALARALGVDQATVNRWEAGLSPISAPGAVRLALVKLEELPPRIRQAWAQKGAPS